MNELAIWSLVVLSVYRVSHMIALEDGFFDLFVWLRGELGQKHWIGRGMHCVLCLSFWLSLIVLIVLPNYSLLHSLLLWIGTSGAVLVVHRIAYAFR